MEERLIAMVPTPAGAPLSVDSLRRAMEAFAGPADGTPQLTQDEETKENSVVVTLAGVSVAVASFRFRIPDETLALALANEVLWEGAADAFAAAAGHALIVVISPSHDPRQSVKQARVLTFVTAAVLHSMSGSGVFWSPADYVISPVLFVQQALALRGSDEASPLWFSFRLFPGSRNEGDESLVCQSMGLAIFLGRELECGPYRMEPVDLTQIVLKVACVMATKGAIFGDGHTFSFHGNESKDALLVYASSGRSGVERRVFRLELTAQEAYAT